jgi:hypothetical protein
VVGSSSAGVSLAGGGFIPSGFFSAGLHAIALKVMRSNRKIAISFFIYRYLKKFGIQNKQSYIQVNQSSIFFFLD